MYEVRRTMYDLGSERALRGEAEQMRAGCLGAVIGGGSKGAGADGVCPCTKYEVRCTIWGVRARCAGRRRLAAPMYDFRFTIIGIP